MKLRHHSRCKAAWGCLAGLAGLATSGQDAANFLTNELPFPEWMPVTQDHYNLKWGDLTVRLDASMSVTYRDNTFLTENDKTSDWGLTPMLNVGFFYPIREEQTLQLDVGVGYTWWNENTDQNGLAIAPRSHLSFRQRVGEVDLTLSNTAATSVQPSDRVELAGGDGGDEFNFDRLSNVTALSAGWRPTRRLAFNGGYSFSLERGLSDSFSAQDRDTHSFNVGTTLIQSEILSYGLGASYSLINYVEQIQSDAQSLFVGPNVEWRPNGFLTVGLQAGYTSFIPDDNGTQQAADDFNGFTFSGDVSYRMNRSLTHTIGVFRSVNPGFGNDFTEELGGSYSASWALNARAALTARAGYTHADISNGEVADIWNGGLGLGWRFIRRVSTGLDWNINTRDSNQSGRSYTENIISLRLGYQF
ncbi:MAG: outer membrane beta-barrel protein [Limisphaerales bacterium]